MPLQPLNAVFPNTWLRDIERAVWCLRLLAAQFAFSLFAAACVQAEQYKLRNLSTRRRCTRIITADPASCAVSLLLGNCFLAPPLPAAASGHR